MDKDKDLSAVPTDAQVSATDHEVNRMLAAQKAAARLRPKRFRILASAGGSNPSLSPDAQINIRVYFEIS